VQTDAPKTSLQVAEVVGYSANWVRTLQRRYNAEGATGLENKRKHNGIRSQISDAQQKALQ
jgi:transposase